VSYVRFYAGLAKQALFEGLVNTEYSGPIVMSGILVSSGHIPHTMDFEHEILSSAPNPLTSRVTTATSDTPSAAPPHTPLQAMPASPKEEEEEEEGGGEEKVWGEEEKEPEGLTRLSPAFDQVLTLHEGAASGGDIGVGVWGFASDVALEAVYPLGLHDMAECQSETRGSAELIDTSLHQRPESVHLLQLPPDEDATGVAAASAVKAAILARGGGGYRTNVMAVPLSVAGTGGGGEAIGMCYLTP